MQPVERKGGLGEHVSVGGRRALTSRRSRRLRDSFAASSQTLIEISALRGARVHLSKEKML